MKFLAAASLLAAAASAFPTTLVAPRDGGCEVQPRAVSIIIDNSASNVDNDPKNLRLSAAKKINAFLTPPDQVSVVSFNTVATIEYALGAPGSGADAGISHLQPNGNTDVTKGLDAGFQQLAKAGGAIKDKSAFVVLTDGLDWIGSKPLDNKAQKLALLAKAKADGVRVSWGHLSFPNKKKTTKKNDNGLLMTIWNIITGQGNGETTVEEIVPGPTLDADISAAALATGGTVAVLSDNAAYDRFVDSILKNGITNTDAKCNNGNEIGESGGPIANNITAYGLCSNNAVATFTYKPEQKVRLGFTVELVSKANKVQLDATLENKATGVKSSIKVNSGNARDILKGAADAGQEITVVITPSGASSDQCQYSVKLDAIPEVVASSLSLPPPASSSAAPPPASSSAAPPPASSSAAPPPASSVAPPPVSSAAPPPASSACPSVAPAATETVTTTVEKTVTAPGPSATAEVCLCKCDAPGAKPFPKLEL